MQCIGKWIKCESRFETFRRIRRIIIRFVFLIWADINLNSFTTDTLITSKNFRKLKNKFIINWIVFDSFEKRNFEENFFKFSIIFVTNSSNLYSHYIIYYIYIYIYILYFYKFKFDLKFIIIEKNWNEKIKIKALHRFRKRRKFN